MKNKVYLGDGLYAEDQGFQIKLWTNRNLHDVHEVYLDDIVINNLICFVEKTRNCKITIKKLANEDGQ